MKLIQQFTKSDLPSYFAWQLRDFARMTWYKDIGIDQDETLHPDAWHPHYFIMANNRFVISSVTVLWKTVTIHDIQYKMYGLGLVLTYPAYRNQGYGSQLVSVATDYIRQDAKADLALLQTMPALESFYGTHGWQHTPTAKVLSGSLENPIDDDGWFMMMFLSDRAKAQCESICQTPFYFDNHIW